MRVAREIKNWNITWCWWRCDDEVVVVGGDDSENKNHNSVRACVFVSEWVNVYFVCLRFATSSFSAGCFLFSTKHFSTVCLRNEAIAAILASESSLIFLPSSPAILLYASSVTRIWLRTLFFSRNHSFMQSVSQSSHSFTECQRLPMKSVHI